MKPDRKVIRDAWSEWLRKHNKKADEWGIPFTAHYLSFKAGFEAGEKSKRVRKTV